MDSFPVKPTGTELTEAIIWVSAMCKDLVPDIFYPSYDLISKYHVQ